MPKKKKVRPKRNLVVTVDDEHMTSLSDVADRLRAAGLTVKNVMDGVGAITGHGDASLTSLRSIKGVKAVEEEPVLGVPPPGADPQ